MQKEIRPPWIAYPEISPEDSFWKYGGEPYMNLVFRPYWKKLNDQEKAKYLEQWKAPADWMSELDPDIDPEIKQFLEELDMD